jgi:hypothetical protein
LLLCGFITLSFYNNALSQEKSGEKDPNKQKDVVQSDAKASKQAHEFKIVVFPCNKTNRNHELQNNLPVIADLKWDKTELTAQDSLEGSGENLSIKVLFVSQ